MMVSTYSTVAATRGSDQAFHDIYEAGDWGARRRAFEDGIERVGTPIYGTLDLNDYIGVSRYGWFRLIYEASDERPAVVLPHNSAFRYARNGQLDEPALTADLASWSQRGELCGAERGEQAKSVPESEWGTLVADEVADFDLIEVVCFEGGPRLSDIDEIRVDATILDSMLAGAYDALVAPGEASLELAVQLAAELALEDETGTLTLKAVEVRNEY